MMRLTLMLVAFAAIVLGGSDHSSAQSPSMNSAMVWPPNRARLVTLSRGGHPLTTLSFPAGTFLSASYNERGAPDRSRDVTSPHLVSQQRWEFHGDLRLHAMPAGEMIENGEPIALRMNRAPLSLTVTDMDVTIENVAQ
jgi:hypothetical protein